MLTRKMLPLLVQPIEQPQRIDDLTTKFRSRWYNTPITLPAFGESYSSAHQLQNERKLAKNLDQLYRELKHPPHNEFERAAIQEHLTSTTTDFVKSYLDLEDADIATIRSYGFAEIVEEFAQKARAYHPGLSDDDIFQAGRNVWSMNFMQVLLGLPVELTPSVFAFSMLYPITDNYLDDPVVPAQVKHAFNLRFHQRLLGEGIVSANSQEAEINDLIGMIESQFPRVRYPQVYESLISIHLAQAHSLSLLSRPSSPYEVDVLGICLEKGGTSVIADGYLTAGDLTIDQLEFMFFYGVLTQLIDDIEDVSRDLDAGLMTIFSQAAQYGPLDALVNRTIHLASQLLDEMVQFEAPRAEPFKNLLRRSLIPVLIAEAGSARRYLSKPYQAELERHFPYHFAFLDQQRNRLERQKITMMKLVEIFAQ